MARKYNIIYADPPWSYNRKIGRGIAETQYQTMSIDEIGSIPVNKITADDAMLFLDNTVSYPNPPFCQTPDPLVCLPVLIVPVYVPKYQYLERH